MNELDAAWLAGLLEGEGSFCLVGRHKPQPSLRIKLNMTDRDVVERAAVLLDCSVRPYKVPPGSKPQWVLQAWGAKAEAGMRAIRPHMGKRRGAKIDEVLATPNLTPRPNG